MASTVYRAPYRSSGMQLCCFLHWLPIDAKITFKVEVLTYKILLANQSAHLSSLINDYIPARSVRSAGTDTPGTANRISRLSEPFFSNYSIHTCLIQRTIDESPVFSTPPTNCSNFAKLSSGQLNYSARQINFCRHFGYVDVRQSFFARQLN